jgi:hypothetical protein
VTSSGGQAVFLFHGDKPGLVMVYRDLEDAQASLESLDVGERPRAFMEDGQVVRVTATDELFADWQLTDRLESELLRTMLQGVAGPAHLAGDPAAYAKEWLRQDDLDSRRPPLVPHWLWEKLHDSK